MNVILNALNVTLYMAQVLFVVCDVLVCFSFYLLGWAWQWWGCWSSWKTRSSRKCRCTRFARNSRLFWPKGNYMDSDLLFVFVCFRIYAGFILNFPLCCHLGWQGNPWPNWTSRQTRIYWGNGISWKTRWPRSQRATCECRLSVSNSLHIGQPHQQTVAPVMSDCLNDESLKSNIIAAIRQ